MTELELHPLARRFGAVAAAYERGRPEYAPAVVGATAAELGLHAGDRVLDLAAGTGKLTRALAAEHPHFDGRPWQEDVREAGGWREPWEIVVTNHPPADLEGVLAHMASMSWIAAMGEPQRAEMLARMQAVLEAGETPERLTLHIEIGLTRLLR